MLKWNKAVYTKYSPFTLSGKEYSEYMLLRKSKCGNFCIYRWESENNYNVMRLEKKVYGEHPHTNTFFYFEPMNNTDQPFESLKAAKAFCEKLNQERKKEDIQKAFSNIIWEAEICGMILCEYLTQYEEVNDQWIALERECYSLGFDPIELGVK